MKMGKSERELRRIRVWERGEWRGVKSTVSPRGIDWEEKWEENGGEKCGFGILESRRRVDFGLYDMGC